MQKYYSNNIICSTVCTTVIQLHSRCIIWARGSVVHNYVGWPENKMATTINVGRVDLSGCGPQMIPGYVAMVYMVFLVYSSTKSDKKLF